MNLVNEELQVYNLSIIPEWAKKKPNPTPAEVHALIKAEVGDDVIWPSRYQVLLKMYKPEDEINLGGMQIKRTDAFQKQFGFDGRVARILAWGTDAFTDLRIFPSGCPYNIGQYVMFLKYENSFVDVGDSGLTYMEDVKLTLHAKDPTKIYTGHTIGK